jgi:hypothetical protein
MKALEEFIEVRKAALRESEVILEGIHNHLTESLGNDMKKVCYRSGEVETDTVESHDVEYLMYTLVPGYRKLFSYFGAWVEVCFESPPACHIAVSMRGPSSSVLLKHMESATGKKSIEKLKIHSSPPKVSLVRFPLSEELNLKSIAKELSSIIKAVQGYLDNYEQRLRKGEITYNDLGFFYWDGSDG